MEPILPEPAALNSVPQAQESGAAQNAPQYAQSVEVAPNTAPEQPREATAQASPIQSAPPMVQPVVNNTPPLATAQPVQDNTQTDDPLIADDVDVIEKEWVDKAKKIVNATKEDPYNQEKEVSRLQADYLMKRYNKQVKLSE
jgi:hypothetical protein